MRITQLTFRGVASAKTEADVETQFGICDSSAVKKQLPIYKVGIASKDHCNILIEVRRERLLLALPLYLEL